MAHAQLLPGDPARVGRYRLTARLGAGGMGVVYLGAAKDGAPVAVKVLRPELAEDPEFRARFSREVTTLTRVTGMCTVRVIEADTQALVAENTGREATLEAELLQLIEQAHTVAEQVEAEAKKVQLKQDEDTRLREEVTRLKSQYEDLLDQKQSALSNVQRLRDLLFQARGVLERVKRRKAALEGEYDPQPSAKIPPGRVVR